MSLPSQSRRHSHTSEQISAYTSTSNCSQINLKSIFWLVKSLVPLESCISYKIVPLVLVKNCLTLGMVNQQDKSALDYIHPILASRNYALKILPIEAKTYQAIIAAYLKANGASEQNSQNQSDVEKKESQTNHQPTDSQTKKSKKFSDRSTLVIDEPQEIHKERIDRPQKTSRPTQPPASERSTLIVNEPNEINKEAGDRSPNSSKPTQPSVSERSTLIVDEPEQSTAPEPKSSQHTQPSLDTTSHEQAQQLKTNDISQRLASLNNITPQQLWQELLDRALEGGIGRLHLKQYQHIGRIVCTRSGVLCLSIDKVTAPYYQTIIEQLKRLAKLPPTPVVKTKKFEMERFYKQERLLLCLRLSPGQYGEEATLQVLRGKALEFYQQRQMEEMGQEALRYAQQLERKLRQINVRTRINPHPLNPLTALQEIQIKINKQLKLLAEK